MAEDSKKKVLDKSDAVSFLGGLLGGGLIDRLMSGATLLSKGAGFLYKHKEELRVMTGPAFGLFSDKDEQMFACFETFLASEEKLALSNLFAEMMRASSGSQIPGNKFRELVCGIPNSAPSKAGAPADPVEFTENDRRVIYLKGVAKMIIDGGDNGVAKTLEYLKNKNMYQPDSMMEKASGKVKAVDVRAITSAAKSAIVDGASEAHRITTDRLDSINARLTDKKTALKAARNNRGSRFNFFKK